MEYENIDRAWQILNHLGAYISDAEKNGTLDPFIAMQALDGISTAQTALEFFSE